MRCPIRGCASAGPRLVSTTFGNARRKNSSLVKYCARGRRVAEPRPLVDHGRHYGGTEGHQRLDRFQLLHVAHQGLRPPGDEARYQAAAILFLRGQCRRDDGRLLRRIIRDIRRKIEDQPALKETVALPPYRTMQTRRGSGASAAGSCIPSSGRWSASTKTSPPRLTSSE